MPIIQNIIQAVYTGRQNIQQATNHVRQYNQQLQMQQKLQSGSMRLFSNVNNAYSNLNGRIQQYTANQAKAAAATRKTHISMSEMLRVMIYFGAGMQILNAMMFPFSFMAQGARDAGDFEHGMRLANTVLHMTERSFQSFAGNSLIMGARLGIMSADVASGIYNIGQSLNGIRTEGMTEAAASTYILERAQKLGLVTNTEFAQSSEMLTKTLNSMQFSINETDFVAGQLFKTIDTGVITGEGLVRNIGDITASLGFLTSKLGDASKKKYFTEMLAFWSTISQTIPEAEASTSVNMFMQNLVKGSEQSKQLMNDFKSMFGVDVSLQAFLQKGPAGYFEDLFGLIKQNGPLMDYVTGKVQNLSDVNTDNAKATALQATVLGELFGNIRSLRGVLAGSVGDMKTYNSILNEMNQSTSDYANAIKEMESTTRFSLNRLKSSYEAFRMFAMGNIFPVQKQIQDLLSGALFDVISRKDIKDLGLTGMVIAVMKSIHTRTKAWWDGGGKAEWEGFWKSAGETTGSFITSLFGMDNGKEANVFGEMGRTAADNFVSGFWEKIKESFTWENMFPIARVMAEKFFFGWKGMIAAEIAQAVAPGIVGQENSDKITAGITSAAVLASIFAGVSKIAGPVGQAWGMGVAGLGAAGGWLGGKLFGTSPTYGPAPNPNYTGPGSRGIHPLTGRQGFIPQYDPLSSVMTNPGTQGWIQRAFASMGRFFNMLSGGGVLPPIWVVPDQFNTPGTSAESASGFQTSNRRNLGGEESGTMIVQIHIPKIADKIVAAEDRDIERITLAVARGVANKLRPRGTTVTFRPAPM